MQNVDGIKGDMYVIDPKAISKEQLYGTLDGTTLEWTDGVFTSCLRKILDNQKGESERRHWIVFDGDVDPVSACKNSYFKCLFNSSSYSNCLL
jgi:dynein heavy chain 1